MTTTARHYDRDRDCERVGEFLARTYRVAGDHINWLQPRWEYMHHHPDITEVDLNSVGVWETGGEIVGVVHMEFEPGTAYFEMDPTHSHLRRSAKDDDVRRLSRLLHRGFDHGAEPPDDGVASRQFMESAPHYVGDLNIVIRAPDGGFASYCGTWYEPTNRIAYIEPLATDPDYRRMGSARAAVLEGVRRCASRGATVAYVGSTLPVFLSIGFRRAFKCSAWQRRWQ